MEAPRIIPSRLEVKGAITSNNVAVPTISSTSTFTNKTLTTPVISGATITGGTISGAAVSGGTSTGATITAPTINGAATIASGATITTPQLTFTQTGVTATGTSATDAATLPTVTPAFIIVTGATGSGVNLPTGPAGALYVFQNAFAGTMRFYCNQGTINGSTGTNAVLVTTTGTRLGIAWNSTATGSWSFVGNF